MVEIDLVTFQAALNPELGEVDLIPGLSARGTADPDSLPAVPAVMLAFELVAHLSYRYEYNKVRLVTLGYVLERDGEFESGELRVLSPAVPYTGEPSDTYVAPTLKFDRVVLQQTLGSLDVDFDVISDPTTFPSNPSFGIAYKITNAAPAVFPKLRAFVLKILPLVGEV